MTINAVIRDGEGAARMCSARYAAHAVSLIGGAMVRRAYAERRILAGQAPHLETLYHHYAYGKPQVGLDLRGAAGGPVQPAVIFLPRNGREVEVDAHGRVIGPMPLSASPAVPSPSDDPVKLASSR